MVCHASPKNPNWGDFSSAIKFGERGTTTEVKTQSSSSSKFMGHTLISFEQLLIQYTVLYNIIHKGEKQYETKYENVYIRKTSRNNNKW